MLKPSEFVKQDEVNSAINLQKLISDDLITHEPCDMSASLQTFREELESHKANSDICITETSWVAS